MMEQSIRKIKFAIVGFGHIGKKHAKILLDTPAAELVAIADLNPVDCPASVIKFSTLDELLTSNLAIDIVVIATPNGLHTEHAIACLQHGKHVVVEKPVALNSADAAKIFEVAEQFKKQVFVVFQNRFAPSSIWLKEIIDEQQLGNIYMVQFNCFWNRDQRYYTPDSWHGSKLLDGGTLFTQFSHFIDTLHWLFGKIENIQSNFANYTRQKTVEFEDSGMISFNFESGGQGSFQFTTAVWDKNLESTITVIGEKGTVKIGGQYMDSVVYCHGESITMPAVVSTSITNHQQLLNDIIFRLQHNLTAKIEKEEVLAVISTIESIYQGYQMSDTK